MMIMVELRCRNKLGLKRLWRGFCTNEIEYKKKKKNVEPKSCFSGSTAISVSSQKTALLCSEYKESQNIKVVGL